MEHTGGKSRLNQALGLVLFFIIVFGVAAVASFVTARTVGTWYPEIAKPSWRPPNWLFGPVWTALYALMALAAWLVWRKGEAKAALVFFFIQLGLNGLWSLLFFGMKNPLYAFVDICALWVMILITMILFWRRSVVAGVFFLPYLGWVSFAGALNLAIYLMNRGG